MPERAVRSSHCDREDVYADIRNEGNYSNSNFSNISIDLRIEARFDVYRDAVLVTRELGTWEASQCDREDYVYGDTSSKGDLSNLSEPRAILMNETWRFHKPDLSLTSKKYISYEQTRALDFNRASMQMLPLYVDQDKSLLTNRLSN